MKGTYFPATSLGRWSVALVIAMFVLFVVAFGVVIFGHQTGGETFTDNLYISIPMSGAVFAGIASFITGLIAILKQKERSVTALISTGIGLCLLIFILGEFLFPH
jgi:cytochrome bd-type quinol oxidase subunit 2